MKFETIDEHQIKDIMAGREPRPPPTGTTRSGGEQGSSHGFRWPAARPMSLGSASRKPGAVEPQSEQQQGPASPLFIRPLLPGQTLRRMICTFRYAPAGSRPLVMGVLNVTPDSFSDGGRYRRLDAAVAHG
jgi:hypothetical protein